MKPIALALLLLALLPLARPFNTSDYDFLAATPKPYCQQAVLSPEQQLNNRQLVAERLPALNARIPYNHWVASLIPFLGRGIWTRVTENFDIFRNYCLQHTASFLLALALLVLLAAAWARAVFGSSKSAREGRGYELATEAQLGLAVFTLSLMVGLSIAAYGLAKSGDIEKSINMVWCSLLNETHGEYIRGDRQRTRMVDYAYEVQQITDALTARRLHIDSLVASLRQRQILNITNRLAIPVPAPFLSASALLSEDIAKLNDSLLCFYGTMEYKRQVMVGTTYLFGNADKFGSKFIGFDNISKAFTWGTQLLLGAVVLASLASLAAVALIVGKERTGQMYLKDFLQYLLGTLCALCLLAAIFNSLYMLFAHSIHGIQQYMDTDDAAFLRREFLVDAVIGDPIVEILVSFFPHTSGNLTQYCNATYLAHIALFQQHLAALAALPRPPQAEPYLQAMQLIEAEVQIIKEDMVSPLKLGRLDPRPFGEHLRGFIESIWLGNFNRAYEYRTIFGYTAFSILAALVASAFVRVHFKAYVEASQVDSEESLPRQGEDGERLMGE